MDLGSYWGGRTIYSTKDYKLLIREPGTYYIRTKVRWRNGETGKFTLSAYAPVKIELEHIKPLKTFFFNYYLNVGHKSNLKDMDNDCKMASGYHSHQLYLYFINHSGKTWVIDIEFS